MAFQFTAALETGNAVIDSQHKKLIAAINDMLEACSQGKGREVLKSTSDFLMDYTEKHFSAEEKLQRESGYPDYENHKRYHEGFKKTVREISDEINKNGSSIAMVGKVNTSIGGWLVDHIKREDVKVAAHIRASQKK